MENTLILATIFSWIALIILATIVYALSRQIGVLHERIKPVGALSLGKSIQVGEVAPNFQLPSHTGGAISLGGRHNDGKATVLFFTSPTCPVCKTLIPILKSAARHEASWLDLAFASDGPADEHDVFIKAQQIESFPYILSAEVGMAYQVSKLPYAVLIDEHGIISAHGLVNNREHLESLFEVYRQRPLNALGAQEAAHA